MTLARTLVVGIGSPHGDDQAGWLVVDRLLNRWRGTSIDVRKASSPMQLLNWLDGKEKLIVCDACRGPGSPGEVSRYDWPDHALMEVTWSGTHDLPLPAVLELGQRLGKLPPSVVIWCLGAATGRPLEQLSSPAAAGLPNVVSEVLRELARDYS